MSKLMKSVEASVNAEQVQVPELLVDSTLATYLARMKKTENKALFQADMKRILWCELQARAALAQAKKDSKNAAVELMLAKKVEEKESKRAEMETKKSQVQEKEMAHNTVLFYLERATQLEQTKVFADKPIEIKPEKQKAQFWLNLWQGIKNIASVMKAFVLGTSNASNKEQAPSNEVKNPRSINEPVTVVPPENPAPGFSNLDKMRAGNSRDNIEKTRIQTQETQVSENIAELVK